MSAFIKLNKQDAFVTSYVAHKAWSFSNSETGSYGVRIYTALTSSGDIYINQLNTAEDNQYPELVYRNLQHLYYSGFRDNEIVSSSYDNFSQTTLYASASRQLPASASLISIPKEIYGHAIKPGTFRMVGSLQDSRYLSASFVSGGFIEIKGRTDGFIIYDDQEGVLRDANNNNEKVGDIIYTHGHAILTDATTIEELGIQETYTIAFQGSHVVYTHNYNCRSNQSQLNFSQNPSTYNNTAVSGSINSNVTGSDFQPYVTTVGLYNDANELIAVGKLGQPVTKSKHVDMTFQVKFDI